MLSIICLCREELSSGRAPLCRTGTGHLPRPGSQTLEASHKKRKAALSQRETPDAASMTQRLSDSGGSHRKSTGNPAVFAPSHPPQVPPARAVPNIFERLQLGKPKTRRALRSPSSPATSNSIAKEEDDAKKKALITGSSGDGNQAGSAANRNKDVWIGIGSSGAGSPRKDAKGLSEVSANQTNHRSTFISTSLAGPSPRKGSNTLAVPGHLKMRTHSTPAFASSGSASVSTATIMGALGGGSSGSEGRLPSPDPEEVEADGRRALSYVDRKFDELMEAEVVDMALLREQSWGGIPDRHRGTVWRLLLGYLPAHRDRRAATLRRKRREYAEILPSYFNVPAEERTMQEQEMLRQILVDLPRTQPDMPLFHQEETQRCMERVLYLWAVRHPASGYVQGMNDLITPFILVFLAERLVHPSSSSLPPSASLSPPATHRGHHDRSLPSPTQVSPSLPSPSPPSSRASTPRTGRSASGMAAGEAQSLDVAKVPRQVLEEVEADVYWCMCKLLDNIQDHYTFSQPGLQRMMIRLQALVERHDPPLHRHLESEGLQYVQFAFRWMNCLLMRELSLDAIIRVWDTELAEELGGFEAFHVYLCAAFLLRFADHLRTLPFQDLVLFLQDLPTHSWTLHEIEPLLSQAHVLRALYPDFGQPGGARVMPPTRGGRN
ncbi:gtpase activating protein [Nannochloropsis gaditana]|uniref:Gtpase activating protein n=1 Tax=Nannochloropsis gaditana TaxID=72520 RepID=W7U1N6_9STRA|nr:gtpase activating protein [Nannochloropsis gaditana]